MFKARVTLFYSISFFKLLSVWIGLAVDYFNERLYWADAKLSLICSVKLNGSDAVVAVNSIKNS